MKYLAASALLLLVVGMALTGGCAEKVEAPSAIVEDVTPGAALALIQENQGNPSFIVIDVRTPEEFAGGHIENAINIDFRSDSFESEVRKLDRNKAYLIYCRSGNRSREAIKVLMELDFREVYNLSVGMVGWLAEGLPVIK